MTILQLQSTEWDGINENVDTQYPPIWWEYKHTLNEKSDASYTNYNDIILFSLCLIARNL